MDYVLHTALLARGLLNGGAQKPTNNGTTNGPKGVGSPAPANTRSSHGACPGPDCCARAAIRRHCDWPSADNNSSYSPVYLPY